MTSSSVQLAGLEKVVISLRNLKKRHKPLSSAKVSYTAPYAIVVHENLQAFHPVGQAKYLETAARTKASEVAATIRTEIGRGKTMEEALLASGYVVLEESNTLVPVDTGFLRGSGRVDVV